MPKWASLHYSNASTRTGATPLHLSDQTCHDGCRLQLLTWYVPEGGGALTLNERVKQKLISLEFRKCLNKSEYL